MKILRLEVLSLLKIVMFIHEQRLPHISLYQVASGQKNNTHKSQIKIQFLLLFLDKQNLSQNIAPRMVASLASVFRSCVLDQQ